MTGLMELIANNSYTHVKTNPVKTMERVKTYLVVIHVNALKGNVNYTVNVINVVQLKID